MNDVSNRVVKELSVFLEALSNHHTPEEIQAESYQISMKEAIVSAILYLDAEKHLDARFWNHLRVQKNILEFLYGLWVEDDRTLMEEFSTILTNLVEYDFAITEERMKERSVSV